MRTKILRSIRCFLPKRFLPLSAILLLFAVAVWAMTAPTSIFEIDGDSATGSTYGIPNAINCDWDTLNGGKTANSTTPTAVCASGGASFGAYGFLVGAPGQPNFTTGGSKDGLDVSQWPLQPVPRRTRIPSLTATPLLTQVQLTKAEIASLYSAQSVSLSMVTPISASGFSNRISLFPAVPARESLAACTRRGIF